LYFFGEPACTHAANFTFPPVSEFKTDRKALQSLGLLFPRKFATAFERTTHG
jgi:hypothetical protein